MVLNRKIKRTMLERKSQYFGSIILIVMSCMLFSLFGGTIENLDVNLNEYKKQFVQEDAQFYVQKQINNINSLERKYNLSLEERKSFDYNLQKNKTIRVISQSTKVDKYYVLSGRDIEKNGEILIDPSFAKAQKLNLGSTINIENKTFKVVGYVSLPDYIYITKSESDILPNPKAFGIGVISKDDINNFKGDLTFYSVKFNKNANNANNESQFKDEINKNYTTIKWLDKADNGRINMVDTKIKESYTFIEAFPIAILVLTCILIGVVMWRVLKGEFSMIGTLYAMGYKKSEIIKHYLSYSLIVAVVGSIVGTLSGYFLTTPMLKYYLLYFNMPILKNNINLKYSVMSLVLPAVFLIPVTYFVVKKALKLSPLELMSGGSHSVKVGILEKYLKLDRFSFNNKFRIREIFRNIPRTVFLILGIMFASMLLLMSFAMKNSMDFMIKDNYQNVYKYNYDYTFKAFQTDEISGTEKYSLLPFKAKQIDEAIAIYGVDKNSKYLSLKDKNGSSISLNNNVITTSLADKLGVKEGQYVYIESKLDSKTYKIKIDKIADAYIGDFIFMPLESFNSKFNLPRNSYLGLWSDNKLNIDETKLLTVMDKNDIVDAYKSSLMPIMESMGSVAVCALIIGIIVIYVVTSLVVEENRGNISLLKILGYKKKEVYSLILNSNIILVIIGYLISIPLLINSLQAMFKSATKNMNMSLPVKLSLTSNIIGFILIWITYEITKYMNRKKVDKIAMVEALKNRNE